MKYNNCNYCLQNNFKFLVFLHFFLFRFNRIVIAMIHLKLTLES